MIETAQINAIDEQQQAVAATAIKWIEEACARPRSLAEIPRSDEPEPILKERTNG